MCVIRPSSIRWLPRTHYKFAFCKQCHSHQVDLCASINALLSLCGKIKGVFDSSSLDRFIRTLAESHIQIKTQAFFYKASSSFRRTGALNLLDEIYKKYKARSHGGLCDAATIYCETLKSDQQCQSAPRWIHVIQSDSINPILCLVIEE
jgi:hypothetical protein